MKFAKVVLGLPVEGPFDYLIPASLENKVQIGSRVFVSFGRFKKLGVILDIVSQSRIEKIKPIINSVDDSPILNTNLLRLSREISDYYCCTRGEAIETILPEPLRKGRRLNIENSTAINQQKAKESRKPVLLKYDTADFNKKMGFLVQYIDVALENKESIIFVVPEVGLIEKINEFLKRFNVEAAIVHSYQAQKEQVEEWEKILNRRVTIVIGTRIAIFSPLANLGLIIIYDEESINLKQEQNPCYNAREIALMRAKIEGAQIIFFSQTPTLESYYKSKKKSYTLIDNRQEAIKPEIKIIRHFDISYKDRKPALLNFVTESDIRKFIDRKEKVLLILNRPGYFSYGHCKKCGFVLRCDRCSNSLVYYYKQKKLICRSCNKEFEKKELCPNCSTSYITFEREGAEKFESSLYNLFPNVRVSLFEKESEVDSTKFDILVSTGQIIHKELNFKFDLVGVISADLFLNRIDFRASEATHIFLRKIMNICSKKILIQTRLPDHYCFSYLTKDITEFYEKELTFRKTLKFPPFTHFLNINLRGKREESVENKATQLYERLTQLKPSLNIEVFSPLPNMPFKVRDNYRYQVILKVKNPAKITPFIKKTLKKVGLSGIIVTVDVDPI